MGQKKPREIHWWRWLRYYFGRTLELVGLFLVTASMILFFGSHEMRPMLAVTGAGAGLFVVGWLAARKNPNAR
ncbi:MAG: hypothetical protein ACE5JI_16830 [Acidobacteriota bacterium]